MIGLIIVTAILWVATVFFLLGYGENLIAGYNTLSKEEKLKYKEKNNVAARNKYLGKTILLPMSLLFSIILLTDFLGITEVVSGYGVVNTIGPPWFTVLLVLVIITHCAYVVIQLNSDRFKRQSNGNSL